MQAVILAAGRGKRLHPITATRTKAMAPIAGKPVVERVMDTLVANGIHEFILVTSPDDSEITAYFQTISDLDATLTFIPQPEPLGMGHALLQAVPYIKDDFILSSCDNLVEPAEVEKMLAVWEAESPNAILTTLQVGPEEVIRMGILALDGNQVFRIVEKPTLEEAPSNIGSVPLYIFSHRFLLYLSEIPPSPRGEYELQDSIQMLIDRDGAVRAFALTDRKDLTTPEDLLGLNLKFLHQRDTTLELGPQKTGRNTHLIPPLCIDPQVVIGSDCVIGPNVYLETGAVIEDGARLENVVVLRHRTVFSGAYHKDKVVW